MPGKGKEGTIEKKKPETTFKEREKLPLTELDKILITVAIPSTINNQELEKAVRTLFEQSDPDKEGSLEAVGLRTFLYLIMKTQSCTVDMTEEVMDEKIEKGMLAMDKNGNGRIEWEELWDFAQ